MRETSALYKQIIAGEHSFEIALSIGDSGRLIDNQGNVLLFGDTSILVDTGGAESAFHEEQIFSLKTNHKVFAGDGPVVGGALSGEIDIQMLNPVSEVPKMARLAPFVRVYNDTQVSEWLQKGVFYIDTRSTSVGDNELEILTIHGYDAMMKTEEDYPGDSEHDYPMLDIDMVTFIAESIGIGVDPRTTAAMTRGYKFPIMAGYSKREVLGIIAACYGGNFIISDDGLLYLIMLGGLPKETNYLADQLGDVLVFGEDRILV